MANQLTLIVQDSCYAFTSNDMCLGKHMTFCNKHYFILLHATHKAMQLEASRQAHCCQLLTANEDKHTAAVGTPGVP
jgi:hypothetical protein